MARTLFVLLLLVLSQVTKAQNLVPNGDFEYYTTCPSTLSQVALASPWRQYHSATSDYFNVCATTAVKPPVVLAGYQFPASGNAFMGGYSYTTPDTYWTEYIAAPITPMVIGGVYEVSMSVSLANNAGTANNGLGIWFYDIGASATITTTNATLNVTPQISYASYGVITDTQNWVRLVATFVADSAYDNIVVGKFTPPGGLIKTNMTTSGGMSYYYFDSVVVRLATHINITYNDTLLCTGDTIHVPYTVNPPNYFNSSNVFTLQLSNSAGSFASPVNIGSLASNANGNITGVIPSGTLPGAGYRIRVISSSPSDTSATNGKNIGIGNTLPAKPVSASNTPICTGNTLNLTATTTTAGVSWKWTGPNGFTSNLQNPSISNAQVINSGNYFVTAYIYGCRAKDTTNAIVSATSGAAIASGNAPICDDDTLKLTCSGSGTIISYSWTGPNSFSSSLQNPSIIHPTVAATGDYYLSAALAGCTVLDTVSVLIKPVPVGLTASSNSPVCAGDSIKLYSGSTTPGVTYLWTGPNSYSAFAPNTAIANAASVHAGIYTISYLLNGCDAQNTTTVVVNPKPAPVTAIVNGPICAGSTLSLTAATTTSGVSYSWTGPNSFSSSTQNPNITNAQTAASGDYIATATLGACTSKDTVTALVKPMPANTNASNNGPVCEGSTLSLTSNTTSTGVTYSWTGPNSFTSTSQNPNITSAQPVATGNYIVTFNLNGCSSNANTSAIVTAIPAKPTAGSNTPICNGTTLNLTASTIAGAAYSWTGPAGFNALVQNPALNNITPTNAGAYIVRAVSGSCYSLPDTTHVTVIAAPNVSIYPNPNDTICQGSNVTFVAVVSNAGSSTSYRWMKNNVPTGTTLPSYSSTGIADGDVIICELTATGVCASAYKDSSNKITMTVLPWLAPSVSITSNPSTPLSPYQLVTFTANATNAGTTPGYQWKRNGQDVVGATSFTWGTHQLSDNDDISVVVTSSYMCPQPPTATSNAIKVTILTGIEDAENKNNISLYPNPNNGSFTIKGSFANNTEVKLEIVNAIGQLVYRADAAMKNGDMNEQVNVKQLASGVYLLRIRTNDAIQNIRFVIDRD